MLSQAVTTVWRTELGTTLSDGFNSTTDGSAYFHYLCSYQFAMNYPYEPGSSPVWPRTTRALRFQAASAVRIHPGEPV